jgi:hypothetical protein
MTTVSDKQSDSYTTNLSVRNRDPAPTNYLSSGFVGLLKNRIAVEVHLDVVGTDSQRRKAITVQFDAFSHRTAGWGCDFVPSTSSITLPNSQRRHSEHN